MNRPLKRAVQGAADLSPIRCGVLSAFGFPGLVAFFARICPSMATNPLASLDHSLDYSLDQHRVFQAVAVAGWLGSGLIGIVIICRLIINGY